MNLIAPMLKEFQHSNLEEVVERATRTELDQAVTDRALLSSLAAAVGVDLVQQAAEHEAVLQVVGTLVLSQSFGDEFDALMNTINDSLPNGEAHEDATEGPLDG